MPIKVELTFEQSQQGVSNDVLVSIEGVEEWKRNVWIKGSKERSPPHNLRQKPGQYIIYQNHKMIADIEERHHGPSDAMHNPSQPLEFLLKETCLICHGDTHDFYWLSHSELVDIE